MSYVRVLVWETQGSWADFMKAFRKQGEPGMKAMKKDRILKSYSVVQTGDHTGLLIMQFDTKAKMNKLVKAMAATRNEQATAQNAQFWIYHGPVKASG